MHQDHHLKWHILAEHLKFVRTNKGVTPWRTDLFPRDLPEQKKALTHFSQNFSRTLRDFSTTERKKYKMTSSYKSKLFPDTILDTYAFYVTSKHQDIEYWIGRAEGRSSRDFFPGGIYYDSNDGDLSDVIKILLAENEIESLLMLANHPKIPIHTLDRIGWGHSFGISHVADWALESYILFNVSLAILTPSQLEEGCLTEMSSYKSIIREITMYTEYDAQSIPHRKFFCKPEPGASVTTFLDNPLEDINALHEYMKTCWELLYRYDMLMRECGIDVDWESEIASLMGYRWKIKRDWLECHKCVFA